ncbi:hypothetical protein [Amycolatopsis lexingtonensis]|uniref:hypothetical protein n=1 Tax=Amycolatopsis lexingtonensis TaxID=218822 RepID=UPI003F6E5BAA
MILRRVSGAVLAAFAGLVVLAGPAAAQTESSPAAPTSTPSAGLAAVGIPTWVWALVSIVGLLAVIVVGIRQLRGRPKD